MYDFDTASPFATDYYGDDLGFDDPMMELGGPYYDDDLLEDDLFDDDLFDEDLFDEDEEEFSYDDEEIYEDEGNLYEDEDDFDY